MRTLKISLARELEIERAVSTKILVSSSAWKKAWTEARLVFDKTSTQLSKPNRLKSQNLNPVLPFFGRRHPRKNRLKSMRMDLYIITKVKTKTVTILSSRR